MGCIYSGFDGKCQLWDEEADKGTTYEDCEMGWDIDGNCVVEDDEDPGYCCSGYESIYGDEEE